MIETNKRLQHGEMQRKLQEQACFKHFKVIWNSIIVPDNYANSHFEVDIMEKSLWDQLKFLITHPCLKM